MTTSPADYPVGLEVERPENSDRPTVFFRIIWSLPILAILHLLLYSEGEVEHMGDGGSAIVHSVGFVVGALVLMLLFRRKWPRWWFDWSREMSAFLTRVLAYLFLLRDEYPSTDEEQAVHLKLDYPDAGRLNRWLPLVKWFLAIPHVIILGALAFFQIVAVFLAWTALLFTGQYPRGLFDFVQGVMRWFWRVMGYAVLMVTDRYPPFSLYE